MAFAAVFLAARLPGEVRALEARGDLHGAEAKLDEYEKAIVALPNGGSVNVLPDSPSHSV